MRYLDGTLGVAALARRSKVFDALFRENYDLLQGIAPE
jgi:hypothetical protein